MPVDLRRPGRRELLTKALEERRAAGKEGVRESARGQGGGGGSVTTQRGLGNYNPAIAPAYRATSDPSKRVAWEFRRRQRLVGEARGAATTASAPPFPCGGRRGCAGGRQGLEGARRGHSGAGRSPPWACQSAQGNPQRPSNRRRELCGVALTPETASLVSMFCNRRSQHATRPRAERGSMLGVQQSCHPSCPLPSGTFDEAKISAQEEHGGLSFPRFPSGQRTGTHSSGETHGGGREDQGDPPPRGRAGGGGAPPQSPLGASTAAGRPCHGADLRATAPGAD